MAARTTSVPSHSTGCLFGQIPSSVRPLNRERVALWSVSLCCLGDRRGHKCLNRTPHLGVESVSMAIPPLVAVLSKAGHHLYVIPGAVEVLMPGACPHCAQFFDDVCPSFL